MRWQVLNLLLYELRGAQPDEALLRFLFVDEHLVDIGDDLVDYEVGSCHAWRLCMFGSITVQSPAWGALAVPAAPYLAGFSVRLLMMCAG